MRDEPDTPAMTRPFFWCVLAAALAVAAVKRLAVIAPPGFPLGEGGLFVLFSEAILAADFALPHEVTYGAVTLPFAYPPAGFYLAAAAAKITGSDLLSVYYWLPIALNFVAVPVFCFLVAQLTRDRIVFLCATLLYVQLPDSFIWQITGGGMPRALAALFALLSVGIALRVANRSWTMGLPAAGLCVGLAIMSHLEWGVFAAIGVTLAFLSRTSTWKHRILLTAGAGLAALASIAPWLGAILVQHGMAPFLSSSSGSNWNAGNFLSSLVSGRMFGLLVWPAMLGAFVTLSRGNWFAVVWAVAIMLLTPRMGAAAGLAIPASILAGYGFKAAGEFASRLMADAPMRSWRLSPILSRRWFGIGLPVAGLLLFSSLALATPIAWLYHDRSIATRVDRPSRDAMHWIRTNTPADSSFVVLSEANLWFLDRIAEWFPFIAARGSLTTPQGLEWAGPGVFVSKIQEVGGLKTVQENAPELMAALVHKQYCGADFVAVFFPPDAPERQSFLGLTAFRAVFANRSAAVFKTTGGNCRSEAPATP